MSVDNISLLAQTAYNKVNERPVVENFSDAGSFHKMVDVEFNKFAKMSLDQILQHINSNKTSTTDAPSMKSQAGVAETVIGEMRQKVSAHENIVRKSVLNEASLVDLMVASNEAKNTVQTMVAFRDKFLEAFDKVMNMQI